MNKLEKLYTLPQIFMHKTMTKRIIVYWSRGKHTLTAGANKLHADVADIVALLVREPLLPSWLPPELDSKG